MGDVRGVIRNRQMATQVRDFSGLCFGNITPTDIDGYIEYKNRCHILIETKYGTAELPYGQRLALERMCDDLHKAKPTIAIIASHTSTGDIDVANALVSETRFKRKWIHKYDGMTVRQLVERFLEWVESR
jgi:hypothetical protein